VNQLQETIHHCLNTSELFLKWSEEYKNVFNEKLSLCRGGVKPEVLMISFYSNLYIQQTVLFLSSVLSNDPKEANIKRYRNYITNGYCIYFDAEKTMKDKNKTAEFRKTFDDNYNLFLADIEEDKKFLFGARDKIFAHKEVKNIGDIEILFTNPLSDLFVSKFKNIIEKSKKFVNENFLDKSTMYNNFFESNYREGVSAVLEHLNSQVDKSIL